MEDSVRQKLRMWKEFTKQHGSNPMKWDDAQREQAKSLLVDFTQAQGELHEVDPQEAARFKRREMPRPEDL